MTEAQGGSWDYESWDMLENTRQTSSEGKASVADVLHFEQYEKPARLRAEREQREDPEWWSQQQSRFEAWLNKVSP